MWKYFTAQNTHRYLDVLPDLLDAYNHAKHRTIGMAPADVTPAHESQLWQKMYPNYGVRPLEPAPKKLKVDQAVRISRAKHVFEKGYVPNWTEEIFKIKAVHPAHAGAAPRRVYKLEDWLGEPIQGQFYPDEVQRVVRRADKEFLIEKVLQTQKKGGRTKHLVKWRGLPKKFNSWVDSKDVKQYK
jgi:hypothetical protein